MNFQFARMWNFRKSIKNDFIGLTYNQLNFPIQIILSYLMLDSQPGQGKNISEADFRFECPMTIGSLIGWF